MLKNFKCKRCGDCCRVVPHLTKRDIERIKKLGFKKDFFVESISDINLMKMKNNKCVFLKDEKKTSCKIYEARPRICRLYPTEVRDNGDCKPEKLSSDKMFLPSRKRKVYILHSISRLI